jgi:hypothetical protein
MIFATRLAGIDFGPGNASVANAVALLSKWSSIVKADFKTRNCGATVGSATPIIHSAPLPDSDNEEPPRTDYNNPAKSTETDIDDGELGDDEAPRPFEGCCIKPTKANYPKLAWYFGGSPLDVIQKTFKATTQLDCLGAVQGTKLYHWRKAPNLALNIPRHNEPVATDSVY